LHCALKNSDSNLRLMAFSFLALSQRTTGEFGSFCVYLNVKLSIFVCCSACGIIYFFARQSCHRFILRWFKLV